MYKIIGADGREYGPVSAEELRQWIAQGRVNAETRTVAEGAAEWRPLGSFAEFSTWLKPAAPPPPVPIAAPAAGFAPARRTNGFAVASLVLGILSLGCICCYGLPFNLFGLACSIIALIQIANAPQVYHGKGMAVAGLVLCLVSLVFAIGILVLSGMASHWQPPSHRSRWL
jgi:hypothetical protein